MEPAILGLVLDSSIIIEAERKHQTVEELLDAIQQRFGEIEIAMSAITVAELVHGIARGKKQEIRDRRRPALIHRIHGYHKDCTYFPFDRTDCYRFNFRTPEVEEFRVNRCEAKSPLLGEGGVAAPSRKMARRLLVWRGRGGSFKLPIESVRRLDEPPRLRPS